MALNSTGPISLGGLTTGQSIALELQGNGTTTISLNDASVRTLAQIASGAISLSNFYGKSYITFGLLMEGIITAQTIGCDKVTYSTDTYSNAGFTYSNVQSRPSRLSNISTGLRIGGTGSTDQTKISSVAGVYFSTLTTFSAAAIGTNRIRAISCRYGNTGFLLNGYNNTTSYTDRINYNLSTLTSSTNASAFTGLANGNNAGPQTAAGESKHISYVDLVEAGVLTRHIGSFNKSTQTVTNNVSSTPSQANAYNNRWAITAPSYCYFAVCRSQNFVFNDQMIKWNPSNNTYTLGGDYRTGSYGAYDKSYWAASDPTPFIQSGTKAYAKGGMINDGLAWYNLGYNLTFATDTWVWGTSVYVRTGDLRAQGVDPYWEPN